MENVVFLRENGAEFVCFLLLFSAQCGRKAAAMSLRASTTSGQKLEQLEGQPVVFCTPEKDMKRKIDITFEVLSFIMKSKVVRPQTSEKIP